MQQLEEWPLDRLIEYARNPRKNDHAVAAVAGAIREFGFRVPILARSDGLVVDGHLRLKAARQLGMETVPVLLADDLTEIQVRAFRLSVNKMAELADWDDAMLALELLELQTEDFDLGLIGFDEDDLARLLADDGGSPGDGLTDPDDTPEAPDKPITQPGDLWILGRHRLLCGDSTQPDVVARALEGESVDLMLTDPPYGIGRDKGMGGKGVAGLCKRNPKQYAGDWDHERCPEAVLLGLQHAKLAIVWGANYYTDILPLNSKWLIWDKEQTMPSYSDAEIAWTNLDGVSVKMFRYSGNGLLAKEKTRYHPTQKPIALLEWCLEHAKDAHTLYEPFSGSGSTLIAAEQTGRRCLAIELSPAYVDVAVRRWAEFTGQDPVRAADGATWSALCAS